MRPDFILLSSCVLFAAPAAQASTAGSDQIVVTATRSEQPLSRIGQAVTIIESEDLAREQGVVVSDVLARTPGITFSRNGGIGTATSVRIRGAESDHTVVLIDGVKLNDPSSTGGGFNFANLLVGNIQRIEVVRGANSVLWGSQAIGGVVNIMTAEPTGQLHGAVRAEYGSHDSAQIVGNVSGAAGPVAASLGAGWFRTDGISAFNSDRGGQERDGYENLVANAKVKVTLSEALAIDLRANYSDGRTEFDGLVPPTYALGDTRDYGKTREWVGYAGLRIDLFDGRFHNRIGYAYTDTKRENYNPDLTPNQSFDAKGENERFEYQGIFDIADGWQATLGAETEKSWLRTASPSSFDPNPVPTRGSTRIDSVYSQIIASPFKGLTVTTGVRHDHHDSFGGETSFGANLAWTPNDGATLIRASYGEGFKAPTLYQLQSEYGNGLLNPETAKNWDVGIEHHLLGGAAVIGATWFHRDTQNQIDFVSCFTNSGICLNRPYGTYDNILKAQAQGLELSLELNPVEALRVQAHYTYTDAENRSSGSANFGNALPRRAKHVAGASLNYRWPFGLSTGASILHVGSSFDNASNSRRLEGYVIAALRASYPLTDRIELYGRVDNLFDAHYETIYRYGAPRREGHVGVRLSF